jgi:Asp-tRNA(Asn)/Glu-tRNA(Gln) amidotransferase A subunit family amidase
MSNPIYLSVGEMHRQITRGELTPEELVERCFERIEQLDNEVQAWVYLDKARALETAKTLTAEAKAGKLRGPLHGIPIGIKDNVDVAGIPTRCGSQAFNGAPPPDRDALVVERLRQQGAIILGKTHTTEFAYFDPAPTRNPYHLYHTPGGSSSGSAAAVASGMVPVALGTQTAASVCRPAAYCGLAAVKPSHGSIETTGVMPLAQSFDTIGFFGRRIADAAIPFLAASGNLERGAASVLNAPVKAEGLRIGVVTDPLYEQASNDVRDFYERTMRRFEAAGSRIQPVCPPVPFAQMIDWHGTVLAYESARHYRQIVETNKGVVGEKFQGLVESGLRVSDQVYEQALLAIAAAQKDIWQVLGQYDILTVPPVPAAAPEGLGWTGDPRFIAPWTVLGGPLTILPGGLNHEGMPLAVMLASPPGSDISLIERSLYLETLMDAIPMANL